MQSVWASQQLLVQSALGLFCKAAQFWPENLTCSLCGGATPERSCCPLLCGGSSPQLLFRRAGFLILNLQIIHDLLHVGHARGHLPGMVALVLRAHFWIGRAHV